MVYYNQAIGKEGGLLMDNEGLTQYTRIAISLAERIASGQSASDAAADCGFCDYSAFYRAYRAHFGHSPRQDAPRA